MASSQWPNLAKFRNTAPLRTFSRKSSTAPIFFILLMQSDNELPVSEIKKDWGVTDFVFEIRRVENNPNSVDKSVVVTRHGLSGC